MKQLNLYNYVSEDKTRPIMRCVYHDNGFKVATDAHILVAYSCKYPSENEGKCLNKDGEIIDGKYPL